MAFVAEQEQPTPTYEGRPVLQNPDGSWSHEESISIEADGKHMNIPTIFGGKRYSADQAVAIMRKNKWVDPDTGKAVPTFGSEREAVAAAQAKEAAQQKIPTPDQGRFVAEAETEEQPSTFQKLAVGAAQGLETARQKLTPDVRAASKSIEDLPKESERIGGMFQDVLRPVLGPAGEGIGEGLGRAAAIGRAGFNQLSAVIPKGLSETLDAATKPLSKYVVEPFLKGAVPPFARGESTDKLAEEFAPDIAALGLFHTMGTVMNPNAAPILDRARTGPTMAPARPTIGNVPEELLPQQQAASPVATPAAAASATPTPAAVPPIADRLAAAQAENARLKAQVAAPEAQQRFVAEPETVAPIPETKPAVSETIPPKSETIAPQAETARFVAEPEIAGPAEARQIEQARDITQTGQTPEEQAQARRARLDTPESRAAHAQVADWAAQEAARLRGMTPEQIRAEGDPLIKAAGDRISAEQEAAGVARSEELQRGSITVNPGLAQTVGRFIDRSLTDADLTKDIIREAKGRETAIMYQAEEALRSESKRAASMPVQDQLKIIDVLDRTGDINSLNPEDRPVTQMLRNIMDKTRDDLVDKGFLQNYYDNYYRHLFEQAGTLQRFWARITGKRPLEGPAGALKERTVPTMREALSWKVFSQQGDFLAAFPDEITANARASMIPDATVKPPWKPLTYNYVENTLMGVGEMRKLLAANEIKDELVNRGIAQRIRWGSKLPEGMTLLDDKIFRKLQWSDAEQGFVQRWQYAAPDEAAQVFNRYLGPNLLTESSTFNALRAASNQMVQARLAFSLRHALFSTLQTGVDDISLAIQKASRADFLGAAKMTTRAVSGPLYGWVDNPLTGWKLLRNYLDPGAYPEFDRTVEAMKLAGARPFQSPEYTNKAIRALGKAWDEGDQIRLVQKAAPALLEMSSKPMMEKLIPWQKLGTFAKLAEDVYEQYDKATGTPNEWTPEQLRNAMGKAWDTVENRHGQMTYDNRFWNNTVRAISHIALQSVGWNYGDVAEFGGGTFVDLPKELLRAVSGKGFQITPRMAFSLGMWIYTGYVGAVATYLMTGHGPKDLYGYFHIDSGKTDESGKAITYDTPTYANDVLNFARHPVDVTVAKQNPILSSSFYALRNRDYFNTQIQDLNAPAQQRALEFTQFVAKQFLPYSAENAIRMAEQEGEGGPSIMDKIKGVASSPGVATAALFGMKPTRSDVSGSPAERLAASYSAMRTPAEVSQEQRERTSEARMLVQRIKAGRTTPGEIQDAVRAGKVTMEHLDRMMANEKLPYLVRASKGLGLQEALNIWKVSDDNEKSQIRATILNKQHLLSNYSPEKRAQFSAQLNEIRAWQGRRSAVNQ
jgi:hypothetical protein